MKKKSPKKKIVISILAVLMVLVASIAFGVGDLYVSGTWRYKMTVEIETPEGLKTGSAVRQISNSTSLINLPDSGNPAKVTGEAVIVDLGERGVLFALVSHKSDDEFYQTFPIEGPSSTIGIKYYKSLKSGQKATLDPTRHPWYPKLVMFTDMNDPKTVQAVDHNDLSAVFGNGVKFKAITIETTDDKVTDKIEKWLPWLIGLKSGIDGTSTTTSRELSNILHIGNFKKGQD